MQSFPSLKKKVEEESLKTSKGGHNSASSLDLRKIATTTTPKNVDQIKEDGARDGGLQGDKLRRRYSADNMRAQTSDSDNHDEPEQDSQEHEQEELFTMDEGDPVNGNVGLPATPLSKFSPPKFILLLSSPFCPFVWLPNLL